MNLLESVPAVVPAVRECAEPALPTPSDLAVCVRGWLGVAECARLVEGVYAARDHWVEAFGGLQFSLGRAWYTDLEMEREADYFAEAAERNALVERYAPGLQRRMRRLLRAVVGQPVIQREGWCGAGVHIFPAGGWVAHQGGEIHFDIEGLRPEQLAARAPALTVVVMLQPPQSGGGLRLWDARFDGDEIPSPAQLEQPSASVTYGVGDALIFDSYRLHWIEPFDGDRDRISTTVHAVRVGAVWESWF
ncbi:2OG-Fe(II) oxygenase family protein [Chloracidobacterium thermophilum]|uniref:Prolyl 4-hydroxylase alpha subunit Fe(2+) 2OG dioxygenase domain-containing protein n=1 Tax=Chloracidobacterium thermophilum (strain B) TaxID=981222 RepID=G2LKK6_CHLTF|nr:hypothetical protein [Chloracidobacterium thermophilum]AEP13613.1 hypothetical protein Cabther_B0615 [Chloracidobacterium thermophilum B]